MRRLGIALTWTFFGPLLAASAALVAALAIAFALGLTVGVPWFLASQTSSGSAVFVVGGLLQAAVVAAAYFTFRA